MGEAHENNRGEEAPGLLELSFALILPHSELYRERSLIWIVGQGEAPATKEWREMGEKRSGRAEHSHKEAFQ